MLRLLRSIFPSTTISLVSVLSPIRLVFMPKPSWPTRQDHQPCRFQSYPIYPLLQGVHRRIKKLADVHPLNVDNVQRTFSKRHGTSIVQTAIASV
ncbi:hypothetical protein BGX38DRAFT_268153 [Terfezia claveryi]|nr:hypothetical protein BGX38DRAFT_268153 [Terfezia claveryi]